MIKIQLNKMDQKGVAATEFIVAGFIFALLLALFMILSETVLLKIKSLIEVRNAAFNVTGDSFSKPVYQKKKVLPAFQSPGSLFDRCTSPYLGRKTARVKSEVKLEVHTLFEGWIPSPVISDHYLTAEDSWKGIQPVLLAGVVARCLE